MGGEGVPELGGERPSRRMMVRLSSGRWAVRAGVEGEWTEKDWVMRTLMEWMRRSLAGEGK